MRPTLLSLISLPWAWFFLNRVISPIRALRLRQLPLERQGPLPLFTGRLTIGAYNICHGLGTAPCSWKNLKRPPRQELEDRLARLADLLEEVRPDLLVLNEVDFASCRTHHINQAAYLAEHAGFPFWVEQTNVDAALFFWRHRYGNALLSRYPLADAHLVRLPGHSWWEPVCWGKKEGLLCSVYPSPEIPLKILGIHLDHRLEATRLKSVRVFDQLLRASPEPCILAGDFNSSPLHYPLATPDPSGQTALSWLLAQGGCQTRPEPEKLPGPGDLTFSTLNPRQVIDWILVPERWRIHSHLVVDARLSDHLLVLMEVEITAEVTGVPNSGGLKDEVQSPLI
jgi:endonuclease/exonuclease/phosphatase family metal-dependent hydrolase